MRDLIVSVLSDENAEDYYDARCVSVSVELAENRIGDVEKLARAKTPANIDSTEDDVERNSAAAYLSENNEE